MQFAVNKVWKKMHCQVFNGERSVVPRQSIVTFSPGGNFLIGQLNFPIKYPHDYVSNIHI